MDRALRQPIDYEHYRTQAAEQREQEIARLLDASSAWITRHLRAWADIVHKPRRSAAPRSTTSICTE